MDHPRSRGVYAADEQLHEPYRGSSPLARGLPEVVEVRHIFSGIIPARAGFTPSRTRTRRRPSDHPRSRGVYWESLRARD